MIANKTEVFLDNSGVGLTPSLNTHDSPARVLRFLSLCDKTQLHSCLEEKCKLSALREREGWVTRENALCCVI